jgi:NAD-dependent deacetylase
MTNNSFPAFLLEHLQCAKRVSVLTGAGISAESGIPTFRGMDGIWKKFNPQELASLDAFMPNPELVWEWYEYRRKVLKSISPNPAHYVLAKMEQQFPHFTISTQNVDGLHQNAGSKTVYELHGSIQQNKCLECGIQIKDVFLPKNGTVPHCTCGGMVRPDVVWFGENLPVDILDTCFTEAKLADVFFTIGTSSVVYPAAKLPEEAKNNGAFVVEINLEPTPFSPKADHTIFAKAGDVLPKIWEMIKTN